RWNRLRVIFRNRFAAKRHVALPTDEVGIFLETIDFKIERAAFVGGRSDVTTFCAPARSHGHLHCLRSRGAEGFVINLVTIQATQVGMLAGLVPKRTR